MLNDTKRDLTMYARRLAKPYETYSIDELANAYCEAVDTNNNALKDIYISALILRFWYTIDKNYRSNTLYPSMDHEEFFWIVYKAIEHACRYRAWQDPNKKLNAQQCINRCIETVKLNEYYTLSLDKRKVLNHSYSMDTPLGSDSGDSKTIGDMLEAEEYYDDHSNDDVTLLIQSYINKNKVIEAILLDNIAFNDVQRYFKKTIKKQGENGEITKYVEHSSEFWPYRLVKIMSKLPDTYKYDFMKRYNISEEKLTAVLEAIKKANNQKIYRYLDKCLAELRASYTQ